MKQSDTGNSESNDSDQPSKSKRRIRPRLPRNSRTLKIIIVLVVVGFVGFLGYQYIHTRNELNRAKNPEQAAKDEAQDIIDEVGKYLELPADEKPTTATVTNKEQLQDQPFFENAQDGDKVLVYTNAKQAILYRPSTGKVIEFAPVDPSGGAKQQ